MPRDGRRETGSAARHDFCIASGMAEHRSRGNDAAAHRETARRHADRARRGGAVPHDVERLARLLDSSIGLPGNVRIGLDGLLGLIPGFGDAAGALMSFYILGRASALGAPRPVLARMLGNIAVDALVGTIPLLGDLFDFAYKANLRNVNLLRRYAEDSRREQRRSWALIGAVVVAFVVLFALMIAGGILIAQLIGSALS